MIRLFTRNNKLIYAFVCMVSIFIVVAPLRSTFILWSKYTGLKNQIGKIDSGNKIITNSQNTEDLVIKDNGKMNTIFELLSASCKRNEVLVIQIEPPAAMKMDQVTVELAEVTMEGAFTDLIRSLDNIQDDLFPAKIAALRFERIENNKQARLNAKVSFESIKYPGE